jgi:hypothetical protein
MPALNKRICFANTLTSEVQRLPYVSDVHKFSTLYEPREIVVARRVKRNKYKDPHILDATAQNLVVRAIRLPGLPLP